MLRLGNVLCFVAVTRNFECGRVAIRNWGGGRGESSIGRVSNVHNANRIINEDYWGRFNNETLRLASYLIAGDNLRKFRVTTESVGQLHLTWAIALGLHKPRIPHQNDIRHSA